MLLAQYFAQFLVLGFTIYVWWAARRDLALRAGQISGPAIEEWERLQEAVHALIADLERRATLAEQRVADAENRLGVADAFLESRQEALLSDPGQPAPEAVLPSENAEHARHEERYAPVYALAAAGVTDVAEVVRRTGLGHGEVALILGLHTRQPPR